MKIFVCAGEPSGDLYAALYLKKIKKQFGDLELIGIGGEELKKAGTKIIGGLNDLSVFGFGQAFGGFSKNLKLYKSISKILYREMPDVFLAVAYPGLNLLLCRYCKRINIKTIYLLPPQIWAWGHFRKYFVKKYADLIVSVFPFEAQYYQKLSIKTDYLRNPLIDYLSTLRQSVDIKPAVGLMPGSRPEHVAKHLPSMIKIAEELRENKPALKFKLLLLKHPGCEFSLPSWFEVISNGRHKAMAQCRLLILSSGTASLEAALIGTPHIFMYRPSLFDRLVGKIFVKIKEFNLVNILLKRREIPTFIASSPEPIVTAALKILNDPANTSLMQGIAVELKKILAGRHRPE